MQAHFQQLVEKVSCLALKDFQKSIRSFALFHAISFGMLSLLLVAFFYLINFRPKSLGLAIVIALFFLTVFSYFVLLNYYVTKKPSELSRIKGAFVSAISKDLPAEKESSEYHLLLANSTYQLSSFIQRNDALGIRFNFPLASINSLLKKANALLHVRDIHMLKEMLLLESIDEHVKLIKKHPTDLEAHASLANAYIALSRLYKQGDEGAGWMKRFISPQVRLDRFNAAAGRAIEELKIVGDYSPNDPWVHAQLASCYHDLNLFDDEIREYETIINLYPDDREILFRLGNLYFQQGMSSKGLRTYETLKQISPDSALEMIQGYDAFLHDKFTS